MQKAEELIRTSNLPLPLSSEKLIAALIPRIGFTSYPWVSQGLPLGQSRFGGPADLPAGMDWPQANGRPLLLMAQLNFGDLQIQRQHPLVKLFPERGWLCLFRDMGEYPRGVPGRGLAGQTPGVVAMQFGGDAEALIRHDPEPALDAETWTHCHSVRVYSADHHLCLPDGDAVDAPLPKRTPEKGREAYNDLRFEIGALDRIHRHVTLLGSPTLYNPDPRLSTPNPHEWMLLLEFIGECDFLAGVGRPTARSMPQPSFGSADFVQYFVRRSDYEAGRLDCGFLGSMLT